MNDLSSSQTILRDAQGLHSFQGTKYTDEVDTRFPPDQDDIDARFGASTGLGDGFGRSRDSDHTFSTSYQSSSGYNMRTGPPKGIFDDV